jgi:hypothetical protein
MSRLAKLQLIGPILLLAGIAGAEVTALALAHAPASQVLWYLHLNVFGPFRQGNDILGAYIDLAHGQLILIGLPLVLVACGGIHFRRMLPVAVASNLSFVYASFLLYAWSAHEPVRTASLAGIGDVTAPDVYWRAALFGCALLSFAASHIIYIRNIRQERGQSARIEAHGCPF